MLCSASSQTLSHSWTSVYLPASLPFHCLYSLHQPSSLLLILFSNIFRADKSSGGVPGPQAVGEKAGWPEMAEPGHKENENPSSHHRRWLDPRRARPPSKLSWSSVQGELRITVPMSCTLSCLSAMFPKVLILWRINLGSAITRP